MVFGMTVLLLTSRAHYSPSTDNEAIIPLLPSTWRGDNIALYIFFKFATIQYLFNTILLPVSYSVCASSNQEPVYAVLNHLSRVKRFDMNIMFMSKKEKQGKCVIQGIKNRQCCPVVIYCVSDRSIFYEQTIMTTGPTVAIFYLLSNTLSHLVSCNDIGICNLKFKKITLFKIGTCLER